MIGDVGLELFTTKKFYKKPSKELIVSFSSIYENTIDVIILDLSNHSEMISLQQNNRSRILFRFESSQLWESNVNSFMNHQAGEYVFIGDQGIEVMAVQRDRYRQIRDDNQNRKMLRSLQAFNFMRLSI